MTDGSDPKNSYVKKWEVLADVHTVKVENGKMTVPEGDGETTIKPRVGFPESTFPILEPVIPKEDTANPNVIDLLDAAKDFAWNTNSDSLREFVAWVKR
jgi:hypothetical protein